MTFRRTRKDAGSVLGLINRMFASQDSDRIMTLEWCGATGRGRACLLGGRVDMSPLLATGELVDWLRAYHTGLQDGIALKEVN